MANYLLLEETSFIYSLKWWKGSLKVAKYKRKIQNKLANTESAGGLLMYIFAKKECLK